MKLLLLIWKKRNVMDIERQKNNWFFSDTGVNIIFKISAKWRKRYKNLLESELYIITFIVQFYSRCFHYYDILKVPNGEV